QIYRGRGCCVQAAEARRLVYGCRSSDIYGASSKIESTFIDNGGRLKSPTGTIGVGAAGVQGIKKRERPWDRSLPEVERNQTAIERGAVQTNPFCGTHDLYLCSLVRR